METQENKQTSAVTGDLQSRNSLGEGTACADKEVVTNVHDNSYPKLFVKLEKLDITEVLEARRKNKYHKTVQPDSILNSENIVTSSNNNNNEKDNLKMAHHPHKMSIKQEKNSEHISQNRTNSSDDISKSDTNSKPSNISNLHSKIEIKLEKVSESSTKDPKTNVEVKVSKTTNLHSSNQSKVYKPGAASKPIVQETASKTTSGTNLNFSSSKTSKHSQTKSNNYIPFDGAAFFHTQMRTNIALQSILKDIVTLNEEYHYTDDRVLEVEIEKLRAKNKLPSLRILDPFTNIEDSESLEDSCPESDDEIGNLGKDSGLDNESQESESNSEIKKNSTQIVKNVRTSKISIIHELNSEEDLEDSKDSERLTIDELNPEQASSDNKDSESEKLIINEPDDESEDEPDYVDVDGVQLSKGKCKKVIPINGTLVEIDDDDDVLECPLCATEFTSINSLTRHVQPCLESKLSGNISTSSETSNSVQNNSNGEGASSIKIERVFSVGKEIIDSDSGSSNLVKSEDDMDKHIKGRKRKKFRRTCKNCDITFCDIGYLEAHFQKTGHSEVYPLMPCSSCNFIAFNPSELDRHELFGHKRIKRLKTPDTSKAEIIEIND